MESPSCWLHRASATWLDFDPQLDRAVQNNGGPDEFRPAALCVVSEIGTTANGHRIRDSHPSVCGLKLGVQYRGVRLVVLTRLKNLFGRQAEVTALRNIEQSAKHRLRIEAGQAQPANATVQA